jgi:hypothetical protein
MNRVPSPPPVGKRFEKGASGNPSGYSKEKRDAVRQLAEIAKERTVEAMPFASLPRSRRNVPRLSRPSSS